MGRGTSDSATTEATAPKRSGVDNYYLVKSRLRYRGGELLMQRLGHLNAVRQDLGWSVERAPARKGIWAFPFPYFDMFYAYHKYNEVLPKELRREAMESFYEEQITPLYDQRRELDEQLKPRDYLWLKRPLSKEELAERDRLREERTALQEEIDRLMTIHGERRDAAAAWIKKHGRKQLPLRQFWYSGEIYTHLNIHGHVLGYSEWQLMSVGQFREALRLHEKRSGTYCLDWIGESFIPQSGGKIR